jgi:hypothetical protein
VGAGEIYGALHIGGAGAAHNQRRAPIDIAVPDAPCGFIARTLTQDHLSA